MVIAPGVEGQIVTDLFFFEPHCPGDINDTLVTNSFDLVINNFLKTLVMFFVVAGSVRGPRDIERLLWIYFLSATLYAAVVLTRFDDGGRRSPPDYSDAS